MEELEITADEALEDLRRALALPETGWEHDNQTWTVMDLCDRLGLSDQAARSRAQSAVKEGRMVRGEIKGDRGYITAYRLVSE